MEQGCCGRQPKHYFYLLIREEEIKEALRNMPNGKVMGSYQIPMEVWKVLGEEGIKWLTRLFNIIFKTVKMPRE